MSRREEEDAWEWLRTAIENRGDAPPRGVGLRRGVTRREARLEETVNELRDALNEIMLIPTRGDGVSQMPRARDIASKALAQATAQLVQCDIRTGFERSIEGFKAAERAIGRFDEGGSIEVLVEELRRAQEQVRGAFE